MIETKLGSVERTVNITINNTMYFTFSMPKAQFLQRQTGD